MKQAFYILATAGALILSSCTEDNHKELDKGSNELTLTSDVAEIVLQEINSSATAINLEWSTGHNFHSGNKIFYTLEIAPSGSDFSDSYIAVDNETQVYKWSKTDEAFNEILISNFGSGSQTYQAMVMATVPDFD